MQVVFCIIKKDFCAFVLNFDSLAVTSLAKSKTMNEINDNKEEKFYHRLPIQIRFNDVDRYGHVNNNAYFAYYDLGKDALENGASFNKLSTLPVREAIGRLKYVPESETKARYDEIMAELNSEIRSLTDGGNEDA